MDPSCFSAASAAFYKLALRHPEQFHISQSCSSASNDPDCSNATVFRLAGDAITGYYLVIECTILSTVAIFPFLSQHYPLIGSLKPAAPGVSLENASIAAVFLNSAQSYVDWEDDTCATDEYTIACSSSSSDNSSSSSNISRSSINIICSSNQSSTAPSASVVKGEPTASASNLIRGEIHVLLHPTYETPCPYFRLFHCCQYRNNSTMDNRTTNTYRSIPPSSPTAASADASPAPAVILTVDQVHEVLNTRSVEAENITNSSRKNSSDYTSSSTSSNNTSGDSKARNKCNGMFQSQLQSQGVCQLVQEEHPVLGSPYCSFHICGLAALLQAGVESISSRTSGGALDSGNIGTDEVEVVTVETGRAKIDRALLMIMNLLRFIGPHLHTELLSVQQYTTLYNSISNNNNSC